MHQKLNKGGSDNTATLYQILFDMQVSISDRFTSLNPISLREKRLKEVCLLVYRLNDYNQRHEKTPSGVGAKKGKIRKPAGDDWF